MAGGSWQSQNKTLPGVYINIKSAPATQASIGDRGVVAVAEPLSWGPVGKVLTIQAGEDVTSLLGYDVNTAPELLFLRQLFLGTNRTRGAKTVLYFRPAAAQAAQASADIGSGDNVLTVKALYPGARGNDISVSVAADPDGGAYTVQTAVSGAVADAQSVDRLDELRANQWVTFQGSGAPTAAAATPLTGGKDGTVSAPAYSTFLSAIEPHRFDVVCYSGTDQVVQAAVAAFVKRLTEDEGRKCQAVMGGYDGADYEGVISVRNGLVLPGRTLTAGESAWWAAGCTAGANYNESLTHASHPGAVDASPRMTTAEKAAAVRAGGFVLAEEDGAVRVVTDVNTLTTFTAEKGRSFSKNRVLRVLHTIANSIYAAFSKNYIGQADNTSAGRDLLKKEIVGLLNEMQANGGVQEFTSDDVTVAPGADSDAVVVELAVKPVDAIEKIYMTVTVS